MEKVSLFTLFNNRNSFLLQHRTQDAPRLPNMWAFFGGGVERKETPLQAVYREAWEEINYRLKDPKLVLERDCVVDGSFLRIFFLLTL